MEFEVYEMAQVSGKTEDARKQWRTPRLDRLTVDLTAIAGNQAPCGDNIKFNGKNLPCS